MMSRVAIREFRAWLPGRHSILAAKPQGANMDFDARQTRRLFLAGTVAFPTPFPSTGVISLANGHLKYAEKPNQKTVPIVVIREHERRDRSSRRLVLQEHVAALFIPGTRKPDGTFSISRKKWVNNFERGEWFLHTDVNIDEITYRLASPDKKKAKDKNNDKDNLVLRGIIFVPERLPIVTMSEEATTAGEAIEYAQAGCTTDRWEFGCTCDKGCTCDWY
jgi:hypothetical protein